VSPRGEEHNEPTYRSWRCCFWELPCLQVQRLVARSPSAPLTTLQLIFSTTTQSRSPAATSARRGFTMPEISRSRRAARPARSHDQQKWAPLRCSRKPPPGLVDHPGAAEEYCRMLGLERRQSPERRLEIFLTGNFSREYCFNIAGRPLSTLSDCASSS
jgi:hypothetical protein